MRRIPAFVNPHAGGARRALEAVRDDPRFDLHETPPDRLQEALKAALRHNPATVVVAGGDGTITTAASVVLETSTALCILRSGTLNHFARRVGIPADPREALELAFTGQTRQVEVGWVNDRLFLNTCVIGLYVHFVDRRDRTKPKIGYVASSVMAAAETMYAFRNSHMDIEIDGSSRSYSSSLLFVGVGERDFQVPMMGEPMADGRPGLHVVAAKPLSRSRLALMAMRAAVRGIRPWPSDEHADSFLVDRFLVARRRPAGPITLDGEIADVSGRLAFRYQPAALAIRAASPVQDVSSGE